MLQSTGARPGSIFLPLGHILMACWSWRMAAVFSGGLIDRLSGVVNALFHLQQSAGSVSAACFPLSSSITPSPLMHTCSVPLSWLPSNTFRFDNNLLTYFFKKDLKSIKSHHWGVCPLVKIKHCMRMQAVFHAFLPTFSRASINCIQCCPFFSVHIWLRRINTKRCRTFNFLFISFHRRLLCESALCVRVKTKCIVSPWLHPWL